MIHSYLTEKNVPGQTLKLACLCVLWVLEYTYSADSNVVQLKKIQKVKHSQILQVFSCIFEKYFVSNRKQRKGFY